MAEHRSWRRGPWRALALPGGEHLVIGATWQHSDEIAARVGALNLQSKQALLNVLPATAAEGMSGRGLQPKAYREATILFVDAVQFSRLAARVDPVSCLRQLDFYFSLFDQITGAFAVEKVTTIGDTMNLNVVFVEPLVSRVRAERISDGLLQILTDGIRQAKAA